MGSELYPLLFQPVYKDYLWGGNRLARTFGRSGTPPVCAESWEIADRPEGMSQVINGALKGQSLHTLVGQYGPALLGTGREDTVFPLLIKLIDARQDLSVQVHPGDASPALPGAEPKTEMWYILDADPTALVYAGLKPGINRQRFEEALREQRLASDALAAVPAKPGRAIFVPGGRPHAIGAGCLLLEVQQNSNTTYRIHDWNRTDAQGRPRELHLPQAMDVIDWRHAQPSVYSPRLLPGDGPNACATLIECPYFQTMRIALREPETVTHDARTFHAVFAVSGTVLIGAGGTVATVEKGTTCLIPACASRYTLAPLGGPAGVIRITRP